MIGISSNWGAAWVGVAWHSKPVKRKPAHGMGLMVQDLSNPMLAQVPHLLLAAHAGTIMGVESNGMQFFPEASKPEEKIHPGIYSRKKGMLDISSLGMTGFGYRADEIQRDLEAFRQ